MTRAKAETYLGSILGYVWICALAFSLVLSAQDCYRRLIRIREYAYACDSFGYLMMAREIRQAAAKIELPNFQIESPQIRLLINFMRARNVPVPLWNEMVAPHAHHYFPRSGYVGPQYPPGTGLALAIFPEGVALHRLNVVVIGLMLATGFIGLAIATLRRAWISAGCLVFALELGMEILRRIGGLSFSVNALMAPLLLSSIFAFVVLALEADVRTARAAPTAAFMAGIFLGLGVLTRLSVIFMVPGFVILLWSLPWQKSFLRRVLPFGAGLTLAGILPVLADQSRVAGAWYLPTYNVADAAPPSLQPLRQNISYYLGHGPGSLENMLLLTLIVGFAGLLLDRRRRDSSLLSARRLALSVTVLWGISMVYFLSHKIAIPYYSVPANFGTAMMLALGVFIIELFPAHLSSRNDALATGKLAWIAFAIALIPGLAAVNDSWPLTSSTSARRPSTHHVAIPAETRHFVIPAELSDERNWIWADLLTGSLRYYGDKTAFKVPFADRDTRAMAYKFVADRGEPQYIILDSPTMVELFNEMSRMGAVLELRGVIAASPYYLVHWPSDGPKPMRASLPLSP